jgi:hypothetical protein
MDNTDNFGRIMVYGNWEMETIIPQESSWENESWRGESVWIVELMLEQWILSVKDSIIKRRASVKIEEYMS